MRFITARIPGIPTMHSEGMKSYGNVYRCRAKGDETSIFKPLILNSASLSEMNRL